MLELRCSGKLHALLDEDVVEVKCTSRWCGARRGVVVLHHFRISNGDLIETRKFAEPERSEKINASPD